MKRRLLFGSISLAVAFIAVGSFFFQRRIKPIPVNEVFPGKVWSAVVPQLPDLEGVGAPTAKNCSKCHGDIYEEWQSSTHAHALSDLQFQAELAKSSSPKWICLNCHIPIQNQRETIIQALNYGDYFQPIEIPNQKFDSKMQGEGVTCATCHVRVDDLGKSYVIGANGNTTPPHPVRVDKKSLGDRCENCHNETYNLNKSLVCYFQTGNEMREASSHFPGASCVSCHLPEIKRSFVKKDLNKPIRTSHKHGFVGGGVPKEFTLYSSQLRNGYKPGVIFKNWNYKNHLLKIEIQNANAGHYVPSGDPERFLKLELQLFDAKNNLIETKNSIIGQEWEWEPNARLVKENRLRPKEIREWIVELPNKPIQFVIFQIYHVKLKNKTAEYMMLNASSVEEVYREKIKNLKEYYPFSSLVLEVKLDLIRQIQLETALEDLFLRNESRRGE